MNPDDIKRLFPFASGSTLRRNAADDSPSRVVSDSERKQDSVDEPLAAVPREATRQGRLGIIVTSFRYKLLDDDNVALGAKPLVDGIVSAGIIPSDSKIWCTVSHRQVKIDCPARERTEIELIWQTAQ